MQQTIVDNRYRLIEPLGSGGMAEVYLAHDEVLDRNVALKILRSQYASDEEFVERFRREAQSAARLSHPNIVSIYDRGRSEDGAYYIAMEYVPRGTLKDRILRDGALKPGVATGVALQVADALSVAHENGVIHRDIKPQNVLVTGTGDAKVTDFGIARAVSSAVTATSVVLGTAGYMSPEQAMGEPVGPQSDLYSLGVVLFEMLTGTLPYTAENPVAQAMKHINEPPCSPREVNPNVPEALDALTLKLLAKNPGDRYASATELANDLERLRSGLSPIAVDTKKMTAPLPSALKGRTQKTAVRPAGAASIGGPVRGGRRRGGLSRALVALLFGAILLGGLALAVSQFYPFGSDSNSSGANKSEAPAADETATILVPDLVWASTAAADLDAVGLKLGTIEEAPSDTFLAGQVIETDPFEGTETEVGTTVNITVSTGPAQAAPLPQPIPAPAPVPSPASQPVVESVVQQFDPEESAEDKKEAQDDRKEARKEVREEAREEAKDNREDKKNS